jgi:thymidylate kinase
MKHPVMIHFFGPDGAGKSTQANILLKKISKENAKVKMCWVRSPHTLAFILWRFMVKIGFYRTVINPLGASFKYPAVDRNKVLRLFWAFLEFVSVLPIIIRVRFWLFKGYMLIAERYILDTVTTIAYFINDLNFLKSRIARLLFYFIPKNTLFIFLDSNYEIIFHRRAGLFNVKNSNAQGRAYGLVPAGTVEPRNFIEFQRAAYKVLARHFNALEIDTSTSSINETSNLIFAYLACISKFHASHD